MFDRDQDIFGRAGKQFYDRQQQAGEGQLWLGSKSDFQDRLAAFELLDRLLVEYQGVGLDQEFDGQVVENEFGQCYRIIKNVDLRLELPGKEIARQMLASDLTLLYDVRETRARQLQREGYHTLYDLVKHEKHGALAAVILEMIEKEDVEELLNYIRTRQRLSSWQVYLCTAFYEPQDLLFFDLETMGLQNTIILLGMGYVKDNYFVVEQLLARSQTEEAALLWEFFQRVGQRKALVSFNGIAFDQNLVNQRSVYNFIDLQLDMPHFDVLFFARRIWPDVSNHKLKTLEKEILDIDRVDDVPSDLVPMFYAKYEQTGNIGPLTPIVYHNQQDIITTARLLGEIKKYMVYD